MKIHPLFFCTTILATQAIGQQVGGGFDKERLWRGNASGDLMGFSLANVGDLNGDGIADIASGSPGVDGPGLNNFGRLIVSSGADGSLIHQFDGSNEWEKLGQEVAACGDLDLDGVPDFAYSTSLLGGAVHFISGATGTTIRTVSSPNGDGTFGFCMDSAGDVNGDGFADLFVSDPDTSTQGFTMNGALYLLSGADGSLLYSVDGPDDSASFGEDLDCLGDIDGDGISEVICNAIGAEANGTDNLGVVFVLSGADGSTLHEVPGDPVFAFYGWSVSGAGDFTGDGVPDFMVGDIFHDSPYQTRVGRVDFFSGADGSLVRQLEAKDFWSDLGKELSTCGDLDDDGVIDHALGAAGNAYGGRVYIHSGATGALLTILESEGYQNDFGATLEDAGDLDGDGAPELLVGAHRASNLGASAGAAYLYEFRPFLSLSTQTISAASGGTVVLDIDFPNDWSLQPNQMQYAVLATGAGLGSSELFGYAMPLAKDGLFQRTLAGNYHPAFQNPRGLLDPNGDATANVHFAAGQATALIGHTFHLCAARFEITTWEELTFRGYSRGLPVTIVP